MRLKGLVVALITGSFLAGSGVAQTSKGILVGVARDPTGAVVPNAKGTIVGNSDSATRTNATKSDASYRLEALNPETYTVTVHQPVFDRFTANNVIVEPSLVTTYDIKLVVGEVQDIFGHRCALSGDGICDFCTIDSYKTESTYSPRSLGSGSHSFRGGSLHE